MNFSHNLHIRKELSPNEGCVECEKLIERALPFYNGVPFFLGFFDRFSTPSCVAHLATEKEQSRQSFLSANTSINQYLPVLAMSTLTTSDLETIDSIETPVATRPVVNTAGEVLRGARGANA